MQRICLFVVIITFSSLCLACPFCNEDLVKNRTVLQSKSSYLLYNYRPSAPGHLMAIPKRHVESFGELTDEELLEIQELTRRGAAAILDIYQIDNYILVQKNGSKTGRSIAHVHFHILPVKQDYKVVVRRTFELGVKRKKLNQKELFRINQKFIDFFKENYKIAS